MNTKIFYCTVIAAGLSIGSAFGDDKSPGEKTSETLKKAEDKTVEAGKVIADDTKKVVTAVKDAVIPDTNARKVEVTLTEYRIDMVREIPAGKTALVVRNDGKESHSLRIEGQGIEKEFMMPVGPNDTKTMDLDLKPGEYKVAVPGKDTTFKGAEVTLRVK